MSAASVSHSPSRWMPDSPRRVPAATTTTAPPPPPPLPQPQPPPSITKASQEVPGDGGDRAKMSNSVSMGLGNKGVHSGIPGSRISFAPGTAFHDRSRLKSRGSSKKVSSTFTVKPVEAGEKPQTPQLRFKLPKATLPSLHYLSVSQEDFLDPRYAEDIVKTYGIPRYFFKSKSNLLLTPTPLDQHSHPHHSPSLHSRGGGGGGGKTGGGGGGLQAGLSEDKKQNATTTEAPTDTYEARPQTVDNNTAAPRLSNRFPLVSFPAGNPEQRSQSASMKAKELEGNDANGDSASATRNPFPIVAPVYKPLIGEKYTHARFFAPMNPHRSLQMESEVTKYVEHKKRVGLGRYVRFTESDSQPTSALVREASMYDLNHQGPAERPLDQYLPPPDRKPFIRQRPRDLKNDFVRSADDRHLIIMSRERSTTDGSSMILKDMVKR